MQKNLRSGDLRMPIRVGKPNNVQSDDGGQIPQWDDDLTWGKVEPITGREWLGGQIIKENVDVRILIRYNAARIPAAGWRIIDDSNGQIYDIQAVLAAPWAGVVECLARSAQGNADGR